MRARDMAMAIPMVGRDRSVAEVGRAIADDGSIDLVVSDESGEPVGVIPALDVLRLVFPAYLIDDSSLAATLDEQAIEETIATRRDTTVAELIHDLAVRIRALPEIDAEATTVEIAAILVGAGCPIAVIGGSRGNDQRFVALSAVLDFVLGRIGRDPAPLDDEPSDN